MYINKYIRVELISELSLFFQVCLRTLNERAEFYMGMYRLIIEYSFVSTSSSSELMDCFALFASLDQPQPASLSSSPQSTNKSARRPLQTIHRLSGPQPQPRSPIRVGKVDFCRLHCWAETGNNFQSLPLFSFFFFFFFFFFV
jgi:hypothetical protein